MYAAGLGKLSLILKQLEATGLHVWTEEEAILFLQPLQARYLLGDDANGDPSTDHCCDAYAYFMLSLSSNYVAGATVLSLAIPTTTTQFTNPTIPIGFQIGVVLDSGAIFWTTVKASSSISVTLNAGLPSSASAQNFVFAYETNITRPLKVPDARTLTYLGLLETPWSYMYSRQEYMDLPNKASPGTPTQGAYFPKIPQGQMFVWPVARIAAWAIRFTWYRSLQVFVNPDDIADLPQEWSNCLEWVLAQELGPSYSVPAARWQTVLAMATQKTETMLDWDRESEDIQFAIGYDQTMR